MRAYKGRTFIRDITYKCGDYLDGSVFPVFQKPGVRRKKCKPTSEIQKKLNQTNSVKWLTRLINANFSKGDLELTPTYDDDHHPDNVEDVQRDMRNYVRRIKNAWKKAGITKELKYCYRIDMAEDGRLHIHVYITGGLDRGQLEELWGKGWANTLRLVPRNDGLTGLCEYIGGKERLTYRRWCRSKNFIIPEAQERDGAYSVEQMKEMERAFEEHRIDEYFEALNPGYRLVEARIYHNNVNQGDYVYFQMVRESAFHDTKLAEYAALKAASVYMRGMTRKKQRKKSGSKVNRGQ